MYFDPRWKNTHTMFGGTLHGAGMSFNEDVTEYQYQNYHWSGHTRRADEPEPPSDIDFPVELYVKCVYYFKKGRYEFFKEVGYEMTEADLKWVSRRGWRYWLFH